MSNQHSNEFQSGSAMYGRRKPYRIEERLTASGRVAGHVDYDDRDEAHRAHRAFIITGSRLGLYDVGGPYRLVLLGPDRTRIPEVTR